MGTATRTQQPGPAPAALAAPAVTTPALPDPGGSSVPSLAVLESMAAGLSVEDPAGRLVFVNPQLAAMLGYAAADLVGRHRRTIVAPGHRVRVAAQSRRVARGATSSFETVLVTRDGHEVPVLVSAAPLVRAGRRQGTIATFVDISARKQAEQALATRARRLAKANETLQAQSASDGLTGVANRRAFDETLAREWRRASRTRRPLALLLLDVDFFKQFNDAYGHPAGDACLRRVAAAAAGAVRRGGDMIARYGGEEFAMLLPDTDGDGAARVGAAIRAAVKALAIPHSGSSASAVVSVSVGVASMVPRRALTPESLLAAADRALYTAKRGGRDRVAEHRGAAGVAGAAHAAA